ncbi:MAG: chromate transporter [Treponemataceae bacterium]|nr:chromate transporter [Treponemataceae bacterium]
MPDASLFELFWIFFYVGLFTIGGGLVAITLMQQTIVARGLISAEQFYNMVAISESTPGPIGVNMATYIGYNLYGIPGGIITTLGEILPSIICILVIATFLTAFQKQKGVQTVFSTLRPAATGLIFVAALNIFLLALVNVPDDWRSLASPDGWRALFNWPCATFYTLAISVLSRTKLHPVFLILAGAAFGVIFL